MGLKFIKDSCFLARKMFHTKFPKREILMYNNLFFIFLTLTDNKTIRLGLFIWLLFSKYYKWLKMSITSDILLYLIRKNSFCCQI